jgi:hypothetical protein
LFAQKNDDDTEKESKEKKYGYVKKKSVNKSFSVSVSDKLNIQNSFGEVNISTWDKNEIKVDVNIEVSANTEAYAQKLMDRITVDDSRKAGEISFVTNLKDMNGNGSNKSTMRINYTVAMPAGNPLKIKNEFGATIIPDFKGAVDIDSKFGKLITGNLLNVKELNVEFGKATFGNITGGDINIKYSNATFGGLSGNIKLDLEFSNKVQVKLENNLSKLEVQANYSSVQLMPADDLSASYTISTSYGSFKNRTQVKFNSDEDDQERGPKFDKEYSGKSGAGNVPVKVKSSFGTVILGQGSGDDDDDKHKEKRKSKTVSL